MHMESFFRREKSTADLYPDISPDKIKHAEQFLSLVSEGTIKTINIDKQSALETLKKAKIRNNGELHGGKSRGQLFRLYKWGDISVTPG